MENQIEFTSLQYLRTYNLRDSSLSIPCLRWQLKLLFYVHPLFGVLWSQFDYSDIFQMGWFNHHQAVIFLETPAISLFPFALPLWGQESGLGSLGSFADAGVSSSRGGWQLNNLWTQVIPHQKTNMTNGTSACLILIGDTSSNWLFFFQWSCSFSGGCTDALGFF